MRVKVLNEYTICYSIIGFDRIYGIKGMLETYFLLVWFCIHGKYDHFQHSNIDLLKV